MKKNRNFLFDAVRFSQLLARRSSGIEGVQEYTAVIVVPKDEDFCVSARLRRVFERQLDSVVGYAMPLPPPAPLKQPAVKPPQPPNQATVSKTGSSSRM
jgi:hypothetical protein